MKLSFNKDNRSTATKFERPHAGKAWGEITIKKFYLHIYFYILGYTRSIKIHQEWPHHWEIKFYSRNPGRQGQETYIWIDWDKNRHHSENRRIAVWGMSQHYIDVARMLNEIAPWLAAYAEDEGDEYSGHYYASGQIKPFARHMTLF